MFQLGEQINKGRCSINHFFLGYLCSLYRGYGCGDGGYWPFQREWTWIVTLGFVFYGIDFYLKPLKMELFSRWFAENNTLERFLSICSIFLQLELMKERPCAVVFLILFGCCTMGSYFHAGETYFCDYDSSLSVASGKCHRNKTNSAPKFLHCPCIPRQGYYCV